MCLSTNVSFCIRCPSLLDVLLRQILFQLVLLYVFFFREPKPSDNRQETISSVPIVVTTVEDMKTGDDDETVQQKLANSSAMSFEEVSAVSII